MTSLVGFLSYRRPAAILAATGIGFLILFLAKPAIAHAAGPDDETAFVFNTFAFLIWGALVMWMCAGFTMLESGSVRTKNAAMICLKNIGLYSIAGLAFFFIGYNLMYGDTLAGIIGTPAFMYGSTAAEVALVEGEGAAAAVVGEAGAGYASMSDWFFQMVFVATTASIVSGALAERVKMWSFFLFILVLTAVIYPVVGAWTWGGGWLSEMGFSDFAGSTIVHSTGGWAALAGITGRRAPGWASSGAKTGTPRVTPPSNILAVTLGVFILWLGWFGFNGGSQLALGSAAGRRGDEPSCWSTRTWRAAAGVMAALAVSRQILGRIDLFAGLNGAIAGLVSITAAPDLVDHYWAVVIGAVGGVLCTAGLKGHREAEAGRRGREPYPPTWSPESGARMAVCIAAGGDLPHPATSAYVAIGALHVRGSVATASGRLLDLTLGIRVSDYNVERLGQDAGELGIEAYPEFVLMPEVEDDD